MSVDFSDQNLLFAIVMMRNGFVSEDQFVSILNLWSETGVNKNVAQLVLENGLIEAEDAHVIENLVRRQIQKHGDVRQSIAYHAQTSDFSSCEFSDESIERMLQTSTIAPDDTAAQISKQAPIEFTQRADGKTPFDSDEDSDDFSLEGAAVSEFSVSSDEGIDEEFQVLQRRNFAPAKGNRRFQVLRPHAKGGLGKVSVARDSELDREVALKEIRKTFSGDKMARDRFCLEACITGGLEHPGVVPVYGFGKNNDGSPYFAMRLIRGETFKDAILDFHSDVVPDSPERRLAFRGLLSRLVDACNAIAYAHSRGVLHRDIKPSNIMLGKFGETLVVDWGLAKKIGREQEYIDDDDSLVLNGSAVSGTLDGSTIGTPTFMSPEQAAGKLDEMKPTSDVYSLGASLYFLLTGKTAFTGSNAGEVVAQVRENDFLPPRERLSSVPDALNSICCKAMSTRPASRYTTALELAADIENWLADEPVLAHRESTLEKMSRWVRHHRTLATSALVTLMTIATASVIGMIMLGAEKNKTESALVQVSEEKERSEKARSDEARARRQTRKILTTVTDDLVGELMARQADLGDSDRAFFKEIINQFESFTAFDGNSSEARNIRADGYFRVANLHRRLGNFDEASQAYTSAAEELSQLVSDFDEIPAFKRDLASVFANQAILKAKLGAHNAAIEDESRAIDVLQQLVDQFPADNDFQIDLAEVLVNRANAYARMERSVEAIKGYNAARKILEPLSKSTNDAQVQSSFTEANFNLAGLLKDSEKASDRGAAESLYRTSISEYEKMTDSFGRSMKAVAMTNLGTILNDQTEATKQFRQAIEIQSRLIEEFPSKPSYQIDCLQSKLGLGRAYVRLADQRAKTQLSAAIKDGKRLSEKYAEQPQINRLVAEAHIELGIYEREHDLGNAKRNYEVGQQMLQELVQRYPTNPRYAGLLIDSRTNFANYYRLKGDPDTAIEMYESVLSDLKGRQRAIFETTDCWSLAWRIHWSKPDVTAMRLRILAS